MNKDARNLQGDTPLHVAAKIGQLHIIRTLLEAKAAIRRTTMVTPASYRGNDDRLIDIMEELLAADLARTSQITAPLLVACKNKSHTIVKSLTLAGVNTETKDRNGDTSLLVACKNKSHIVVKNLVLAGADIETEDMNGDTSLHAVWSMEVLKL